MLDPLNLKHNYPEPAFSTIIIDSDRCWLPCRFRFKQRVPEKSFIGPWRPQTFPNPSFTWNENQNSGGFVVSFQTSTIGQLSERTFLNKWAYKDKTLLYVAHTSLLPGCSPPVQWTKHGFSNSLVTHGSKNNKNDLKSNVSLSVDAILVTASAVCCLVFASWQLSLQFKAV